MNKRNFIKMNGVIVLPNDPQTWKLHMRGMFSYLKDTVKFDTLGKDSFVKKIFLTVLLINFGFMILSHYLMSLYSASPLYLKYLYELMKVKDMANIWDQSALNQLIWAFFNFINSYGILYLVHELLPYAAFAVTTMVICLYISKMLSWRKKQDETEGKKGYAGIFPVLLVLLAAAIPLLLSINGFDIIQILLYCCTIIIIGMILCFYFDSNIKMTQAVILAFKLIRKSFLRLLSVIVVYEIIAVMLYLIVGQLVDGMQRNYLSFFVLSFVSAFTAIMEYRIIVLLYQDLVYGVAEEE